MTGDQKLVTGSHVPSDSGAQGSTQTGAAALRFSALEPYISRKRLEIHYTKHHAAYVDGLNKAEFATGRCSVRTQDLAFNGSGHILHSIYWTNMAPNAGGKPTGMIGEQINAQFGSYEAFRDEFTQAALAARGSGWGILVWQPMWGRMEILTASRHEDLTQWGTIPIRSWTCGARSDYQNRKADYVTPGGTW